MCVLQYRGDCHGLLAMNNRPPPSSSAAAAAAEGYVGVLGSQSHRSSRGSDTSSAYSGSDTMHSVPSSDQVTRRRRPLTPPPTQKKVFKKTWISFSFFVFAFFLVPLASLLFSPRPLLCVVFNFDLVLGFFCRDLPLISLSMGFTSKFFFGCYGSRLNLLHQVLKHFLPRNVGFNRVVPWCT